MNLSKKQVKLFRRIHRKYKVSFEFLTANINKVTRLYKYATSLHIVIKKKFHLRKNRAFIVYNRLRKNLFQTKRKNISIKNLPWTKRCSLHRRKLRAIQKLQYDENVEKTILEDKIVEDKIVEDKIVEDKIVEDKIIEDRNVENENTRIESRILENENIVDKIVEDDNIEDGNTEDNNIEDNNIENDDIEDDNIEDEITKDENIEDEISEEQDDPKLSPEEVQQKLKEQLDMLKSGKRTISLLGNTSNTERSRPCSTNASAESSQRNSPNHLKENLIVSNIVIRKPDLVKDTSINNIIQETTDKDHHIEEENVSADGISMPKKSGNFLDSLINKLKCNDSPPGSSSSSESDTAPFRRLSLGRRVSLPQPLPPKQASDEETSCNSSDFHGFTEHEVDKGHVPGMLATPIVNNMLEGAQHSAFVSEDLDNFMKENSFDNCTSVEIPHKKVIEEGLVCDGAPIPKMYMPAISDEHTRPRTVAEKRSILLQKQNNMKYWMLDDEHTIYRELQRRSKPFYKPNLAIAKHVQRSAAPAARDCWKAGAWLSTEKGRFFLQIANIDSIEYKIIGTRGNNYSKFLPKQSSMVSLKKLQKINCPPACHRLIKNFKRLTIINPRKKEFHLKKKLLTTPDLKIEIDPGMIDFVPKPSPLSKKCMINQSNNLNLGPLEIYEMPKIELEVFPKVDKPLDEFVKPYLKMIMPSDNISREWAEFAVSTLVTTNINKRKCRSKGISLRESFKFEIPFVNNEDRLLVRKIFKRQEQFEKYFNYGNLEFSKNIDKSDSTEVACADMITDMINSIALGLSENSIIKQDPDINYTDIVKTNEMTIEEDNQTKHIKQAAAKKEKHGKQKLLSELKRLNATVIDADCFYEKDIKECKELHCRLGCVCQSLIGRPIMKKHCRKLSCMFECVCKQNPLVEAENFNKIISDEDALLLREKATARLAKVEKDFCSTVVLTDNRTFLINESQSENRKRPKKAPKRYDDYSVACATEEDTNKKSEAIYHNDSQNDILNKENSLKENPLYIISDEKTIERFKHCAVSLKKLKGFETVQPWCMIHCLYKCFCENKATSGIPFKIQKVDDMDADTVIQSRKPTYSFAKKEKDKSVPKKKVNAKTKFDTTNSHQKKPDSEDIKSAKSVLLKYYKSCFQYGSRTTKIPVGWYRKSNKEYYRRCLRKNIPAENDKHQKVLERKIRKSLTVSEPDGRKPKNRTIPESKEISMRRIHNNTPTNMNNTTDTTSIPNFDIPKMPIIASVCSLNTSPMVLGPTKTPSSTINEPIITKIAMSTPISIPSEIRENDPFENNPKLGDLITDKNMAHEISASRDFHNKSILKLNLAVTKTMNSVRSIQKKNTKHLPTPVSKTLSSHQWKYFLQAYQEGLIFVWDIKIKTTSIVAVTKTNIMPLVPNALSIINIKAIRTETLPLVGKMLNANIMNDKLKTLSVLLTGHTGYWRIIGFINSTSNYLVNGCIARPTPETHPRLSEKVNQLFKMLMLRELKIISDFKNKRESLLKSITNNNNNNNKKKLSTTPSVSTITKTTSIQPSTASLKSFTGIPKAQLPPSNIAIKKVPANEIESIYIPIPIVGNHRWLMLSLVDDFSHIYVPTWKNFLSCDKIKKAISIAIRTKKTVRLGQGISDLDVYATSEYKNRVYVGPFPFAKKLDIILYQNVDGRMMLREDFERSQNIQRSSSTVGCWLYMKNDQLILRDEEQNSDYYDKNINTVCDDDCQIVGEEEKDEHEDNFSNNIVSKNSDPKQLNQIPDSSLTNELVEPIVQHENPFNQTILVGYKKINSTVPLLQGRTLTKSEDQIIKKSTGMFAVPSTTTINQNKSSFNSVPVRAKPIMKRRMTEHYSSEPPNKLAKNPLQSRLSKLDMNSLNLSLPSQTCNQVTKKNLLNIKQIPPMNPSGKVQHNSINEIKGPVRLLLPASSTTNHTVIIPNNLPKCLSITKESVEKYVSLPSDISISLQTEENPSPSSSGGSSIPSCNDKITTEPMDSLLEPESSIKSFTIIKSGIPLSLDNNIPKNPSTASNLLQISKITKIQTVQSTSNLSEPSKSDSPTSPAVSLTSSIKDKNPMSLSDAKQRIKNANASKLATQVNNPNPERFIVKSIVKRPFAPPINTSVPKKMFVSDVKNAVSGNSNSSPIAKLLTNNVLQSAEKDAVPRTSTESPITTSMPSKLLGIDKTTGKNSLPRTNTSSPMSTSMPGQLLVQPIGKSSVPRTATSTVTSSTLSTATSLSSAFSSSSLTSLGKKMFKINRSSVGGCATEATISSQSSPLKIVEAVSLAVPISPERNNSEYGFLISNVIALGKIPTKKLETGYLIKIPHYNSPIKVAGIAKANEILQNYLRVRIKEFMPNNLYLNWRFINSADPITNRYKLHNVQLLTKEMIITSCSILQRRSTSAAKSSSTSDIPSKDSSIQLSHIEALKQAKKTVNVMKTTENDLKTNISPKKIAQVATASKPKLNQLKETVPLAGDKKMKNLSNPPSKLIETEVILIDDDDDDDDDDDV